MSQQKQPAAPQQESPETNPPQVQIEDLPLADAQEDQEEKVKGGYQIVINDVLVSGNRPPRP